jgi:hypothetical protein
MSNQGTIGGTLDLAALATPAGICANCFRVHRATTPRPPFCWCWHSRTLARQRRDTWKVLTNVTDHELRALLNGEARK